MTVALPNTASLTAANPVANPLDAKKGRLKQSVCKWCYGKLSVEEMCKEAVKLGLVGIDLLKPEDFATLKSHGLVCTMVSSHSLSDGSPGPVQLHAWHPRFAPVAQNVDVVADQSLRVDLEMGVGRGEATTK